MEIYKSNKMIGKDFIRDYLRTVLVLLLRKTTRNENINRHNKVQLHIEYDFLT